MSKRKDKDAPAHQTGVTGIGRKPTVPAKVEPLTEADKIALENAQKAMPQFEEDDGQVVLVIPRDCTMHELHALETEAEKMAQRGDVMARRWILQRKRPL